MFPESWKENKELVRRVKELYAADARLGTLRSAVDKEYKLDGTANIDDFLEWCYSSPMPPPTKSGWYWARLKRYEEFEPVEVTIFSDETKVKMRTEIKDVDSKYVWDYFNEFGDEDDYPLDEIAEWGKEILP